MDPLQLADLEVKLVTEKKELEAKEKELADNKKELVEKSAPTDGNEWKLLVAQQQTLATQQGTLAARWKGMEGPLLPST